MKKFDRGEGRKFGGGFEKKRFGNKGGFGDRPMMYQAICSQCGRDCEVPFKPAGGKPVFCNDCFKGNDRSEPRKFNDHNFSKPQFGEKKMYSAVCDKCGRDCEVPFKPSGDKPIYCSNCFDRGNSAGPVAARPDNRQLEDKLEAISAKLDRILKVLAPISGPVSAESAVITKPEAKVKTKVKEIKKPTVKVAKKLEKKAVKKAVKKSGKK